MFFMRMAQRQKGMEAIALGFGSGFGRRKEGQMPK
jgi:hypothetical protein